MIGTLPPADEAGGFIEDTDTQNTRLDLIDRLFERAADLAIDAGWVDALNPRPRVWPSVAELLREQFPDLRERYRRVLFDRRAREECLVELRRRVARAAQRFSVHKRVSVCF